MTVVLHVLGSGSRGNAFALATPEGTLLVEAGFSTKEMLRRAEISGIDLGTVVGIAITHEHGDHARGAVRLARKLAVPILASGGTWRRLVGRDEDQSFHRLGLTMAVELGPFSVTSAPIVHDAGEPLALLIETTRGVRVGFAFDLGRPTISVRYLLRHATALVLESNYDELLLRTSNYPASVQQRIAGSAGHLSNRVSGELLRELCHPGLQAVVLAHLSQQCNTPGRAIEVVGAALARAKFEGTLAAALQDEVLPAIPLQAELTLWNSGTAFIPSS